MNQQQVTPRMTVEGNNEEIGGTAISRSIWTWARLVGGAAPPLWAPAHSWTGSD